MKFLRELQDKQAKLFEPGAPLERFYPLYEANDTFLFTPGHVTKGASHIRDGIDLKRLMVTVVVALVPCMFMAMYNTGYQAHLAIAAGAEPLDHFATKLYQLLGFPFDPGSFLGCLVHGAFYYIPIYVVTLAAGGLFEVAFAIVRRHEVSEGFLVTSALIPLTLPATIPLWQVALGTIFGVVVAKELFGGVGMNIFNPALMARAFMFFAYPAQISGDMVWIPAKTTADALGGATAEPEWLRQAAQEGMVDGYSGATLLARAAEDGVAALDGVSWWTSFFGLIPGSMGETSTFFCILGAVVLIVTGVGSWRTMAGVLAGSLVMIFILNGIGSETNPFFGLPFYWHWTLGGFAFATVYMATDPVSSAFTNFGRLVYGFSIGMLGILIRVLNPAYPEGWMLAILFLNMFAPFIDYFVVQANIKRRKARYAT